MFNVNLLGKIMAFLYNIFNNYGISIIVFTIISKIILLPISIIVQKNSIKMVKIQPKVNKIKINYFGDKDKIAEEESKLYKKEGYNAFASLIPLVIQILLLIGLVEVINHPLTHIIGISNQNINNLTTITLENSKTLSKESSSLELEVVKAIKNNKNIEDYEKIIDNKNIESIKKLNLNFLGFDLSFVATVEKGIAILIPIIAGLSALIMCYALNKMNVLQIYQSNINKYGMLVISVLLSLYLGSFVPAGVALYWTASNLLAILQQFLLNIFINPKKYVNHDELEKTSAELKELTNLNKNKKRTKEQIKKEKEDYKRFFKVVNKHLVFYSESNGFYKYYKGIIEYILNNTNIIIHYITSDYNDNIFKLNSDKYIVNDDSEDKSTVINELDNLKLPENAKRAKELYRNAFHAGIASIVNDSRRYNEKFIDCLTNSCSELKLLTTTGQGLIINHKTEFEQFLLSGKDICILIGLKNSPFLNEVGLSESTLDYSRTNSLNDETNTVLNACVEIFAHASAKAKEEANEKRTGKRIGSFKIAGFNTQFRSTIVLCELNNNNQWGWVTITLPPAKALGSVSLEFDSRLHSFSGYDAASKDSSLPTMAENHFTKVWNEAEEANRIITLDESIISSIKNDGYPKELTYE